MSKFKLSPDANTKAKEAIKQAMLTGEPYCVLSFEKEGEDSRKYTVHPYTGLAVDRKKVVLEFFASARVEPQLLRDEGILW